MDSRSVSVQVPADIAKAMALIFGDKRNILWPVANLNLLPIDLSNARSREMLDLPGDFLYCDGDTTGKAFLRFNNPSMPPMPFKVNSGIRGFPIQKIFLTNTAQPGLVLNLWWGYGADIIPPNQDITTIGSITNPVTVNIFDDATALADLGFIGGTEQGAGGAGTNSMVQLWNPGGGKILYCDSIIVDGAVAGDLLNINDHNVAFGTLTGNGRNKDIGGAAPQGQIRRQAPVGGVGNHRMELRVLGNTPIPIPISPPIRIGANLGLHVENSTVNQVVDAAFQWREKTV